MDEPQNPSPEPRVLTAEPLREPTSEIAPTRPDSKTFTCNQEETGEPLLPETVLRDLLRLGQAMPSTTSQPPHDYPEARTLSGSASAPVTPRRIAHYDVFDCLGTGGFALVYRAFDRILKRPRALKLARPDVLTSPALRRRFLGDAVALARLDHPNIVRIYDADESGGLCYIAMELCESGSLADWLKTLASDEVLPAAWVAKLVSQIADGVQHAHEHRIYHRDLKPGNILLTLSADALTTGIDPAGVPSVCHGFLPKVSDFGLAKIIDDQGETNRTRSGIFGTIKYMAPEQISEPAKIGPATDVYGLGVILYELLTRRRPFEGPGDARILDQIRTEEPPPLHKIRKDLPGDLETVCLKCLEKNPRDRYQRPSELANELRRILEKLPTLARPTPLWSRCVRRVKQHPVLATLTGMILIAGLVAAEYVDHRWRGEIDLELRQLASAEISDLPQLVTHLDSRDRAVADRLGLLFEAGRRYPKLGAGIVLASQRPDCAAFCYDWLLDAKPGEIRPIAPLLISRMPGLVSRLQSDVDRPDPAPGSNQERNDQRRANAACALILLDHGDRAWPLLRFASDPQARSFLIRVLGPSGVEPRRIIERLDDPATEVSVRRALIQSLDGIAENSWDANLQSETTNRLLDLYRNDPDSGVHGSAKWLLHRWRRHADLEQIDRELARSKQSRPDFQWRISQEGLTLITVETPDRVIEVSDTEIMLKMFRLFDKNVFYSPDLSPVDTCPVNGISFHKAAAFCNWLSSQEGLSPGENCYRPSGTDGSYQPIPKHRTHGGFRLPTSQEFRVFCAAGTKTSRYCGDSDQLFDRYAWTWTNTDGKLHSVGELIPNEFGLFDTLGNLYEWCEREMSETSEGVLKADLRGGWFGFIPSAKLGISTAVDELSGNTENPTQGFRIVRTITTR